MDTATMKQRLQNYIAIADDKIIIALYTILESEIEKTLYPLSNYDETTLEMFDQRKENHLQGKSQSYTAEEAIQSVKGLNNTAK
jgi:hypothetical protein